MEPIFKQDPAEVLDYAVDFSAHCARLREPNTDYAAGVRVQPARATGLQYNASTGGRTGTSEPRWPTVAAQTVKDGSVVWTAEAISSSSKLRSLSSAAWVADTGLTVATPAQDGDKASALISAGTNGQRYQVRVTGTFSDGTAKASIFFVEIVRPK